MSEHWHTPTDMDAHSGCGCGSCQAIAEAGTTDASCVATPVWQWTSPHARNALASRDLAAILHCYRKLTATSQHQLAFNLGFDRTYLSAIENGRRTITNADELRRIAKRIGIPAHVLGITDTDDSDYHTLIAFAESTLRLANLARNTGHPAHAIHELWPLIQRLESRVADCGGEPATLTVLARARIQLGICLGDILPEQQLEASAQWTGRALYITAHLDDPGLHTTALRAHGNELRKAGNLAAAVRRLELATEVSPKAETFIALARAAAEAGNHTLFNDTINTVLGLSSTVPHTPLFNDLVCWEVHVRGLIHTKQLRRLPALLDAVPAATDAAPQWKIIAAITTATALHALGDTNTADILSNAITEASHHQLPHQIQRAVRTAAPHHPDLSMQGTTAVKAIMSHQVTADLDSIGKA